MPRVFIGGTDTGVGKTYVSCSLLRSLAASGQRALGYKPVAAGCELTAHGWENEDARLLRAASSVDCALTEINPCALRDPLAPHIAARRQGRSIDPPALAAQAERLAARTDWLLIEGAGGLRVPLTAELDCLDWVAAQGWPVLLVVGMRLGCLNHALLSAEALTRRGLHWTWVENPLPPRQIAYAENRATLIERLGCTPLDWQGASAVAELTAFVAAQT